MLAKTASLRIGRGANRRQRACEERGKCGRSAPEGVSVEKRKRLGKELFFLLQDNGARETGDELTSFRVGARSLNVRAAKGG